MNPLRPLWLVSLLWLPATLQAQNQLNLGVLEPGQLVLNLTTTDQREVEQDTLNATLDFVLQGRDRGELQDSLNATMTRALALVDERAVSARSALPTIAPLDP